MRGMIAALVLCLAMGACDGPPAARSRTYFEGHPARLVEVLARCRRHPGERGPACVNAYAAEEALPLGTLRPFAARSDRSVAAQHLHSGPNLATMQQ